MNLDEERLRILPVLTRDWRDIDAAARFQSGIHTLPDPFKS